MLLAVHGMEPRASPYGSWCSSSPWHQLLQLVCVAAMAPAALRSAGASRWWECKPAKSLVLLALGCRTMMQAVFSRGGIG